MFIGWLVPNRGMERFFGTSLQCQIFRNMISHLPDIRVTQIMFVILVTTGVISYYPFCFPSCAHRQHHPRPIRVSITLASLGFGLHPRFDIFQVYLAIFILLLRNSRSGTESIESSHVMVYLHTSLRSLCC